MENPDLRKSMGMAPDQKGVRIRRIEPTSPEFQFLKPSDIIISFDGINIANDGTGKLSLWLEFKLVCVMQYLVFSLDEDTFMMISFSSYT